MKRTPTALILYHSHSGNTKSLAELAEKELSREGWKTCITPLVGFMPEAFPRPDLVVLGVPTHFWQMPETARVAILGLPRFDGAGGFVFSTYGNVFPNDVPLKIGLMLKKKGVRILGGAAMAAPHNFMSGKGIRLGDAYPEFGLGLPEKKDIEAYRKAVNRVAKKVQAGDLNSFKLKKLRSPSKALTFLDHFVPTALEIKSLAPVQFDALLCKDCGKCVKGCDTGSIERKPEGGMLINQKTCKKCYTCARECPTGAMKVQWFKNEIILRIIKKILPHSSSVIRVG